MTIRFVLDPVLGDDLREQIVALWAAVTNAGGAVGFVAPVTTDDVRPTAEQAFAAVAAGHDHLLIGLDRDPPQGGGTEGHAAGGDGAGGERLVALLFVVNHRFALKEHWRVLKRVMVAPDAQGRGYGAALMRQAAAVGREQGLSALQVTVRGGHDIEGFYAGLGYREVGRLPGALRVAPDDDRDEILMWLSLA
jgi:GNAT superfamily N-acetyltransferase